MGSKKLLKISNEFYITENDLSILSPILDNSLRESFGNSINEFEYAPLILESKISKQILVEQILLEDVTKEYFSKYNEEMEFDAEIDDKIEDSELPEDQKDDFISGASRLIGLGSKSFSMYKKIKEKSGVLGWVLGGILASSFSIHKRREEAATFSKNKEAVAKSEKIVDLLIKKGKFGENVSSAMRHELVGRYAVSLNLKMDRKAKLDAYKTAKASGSIIDKVKKYMQLKFHDVKSGYAMDKLYKYLDLAKKWASQNKLMAFGAIALAIGLFLFTVFKWNTIKRVFKLVLKILFSPLTLLIKGIKWLFGKAEKTYEEDENSKEESFTFDII